MDAAPTAVKDKHGFPKLFIIMEKLSDRHFMLVNSCTLYSICELIVLSELSFTAAFLKEAKLIIIDFHCIR
jgi:hypothetical protein